MLCTDAAAALLHIHGVLPALCRRSGRADVAPLLCAMLTGPACSVQNARPASSGMFPTLGASVVGSGNGTGLVAGTTYDVYMAAQDTRSNRQATVAAIR